MSHLTAEAVNAILTRSGQSLKAEADCEVTLDDINALDSNENLLKMYKDIVAYNKMLSESITFINNDLTNIIPFTRENLYLMCGYTGNGKSSVAANISFPLWKQGKKCLVIANEEPQQDVYFRIACLEFGLNFNAYKKGEMSEVDKSKCMRLFPEIKKFIKVLDVTWKNGITSKLEGVISILEQVKTLDYSCVLIDYYQLICKSVKDSSKSKYEVLDSLKSYLQIYIRNSSMPIVLFAQLHSLGKRNNAELDSRVKECPAILEAATVVIEIIPNFEETCTDFIIKKDRFGKQGAKVVCGFDKGRYVEYTDAFKRAALQRRLDNLTNKAVTNVIDEDAAYLKEDTERRFAEEGTA